MMVPFPRDPLTLTVGAAEPLRIRRTETIRPPSSTHAVMPDRSGVQGQIVGWITAKTGQQHAVLWTLRRGT